MSNKSPNSIDHFVAARVRMARLMAGLSQTELADKLGVTFQQVQKYEKGINRIGAGRLQQIAGLLVRPVSWFFDEQQVKAGAPDVLQRMLIAHGGIALAEAYLALPIGLRHALVDVAKAMVVEIGAPSARRKAA